MISSRSVHHFDQLLHDLETLSDNVAVFDLQQDRGFAASETGSG